MIPTLYGDDLTADFTLRTQPTRTYRLNFGGKPSTGMLDGQEAMKQTIFMILHSERYAHEIFSWNYGVELVSRIGQANTPLLESLIRQSISEALLQDDRILRVENFAFVRNRKRLTVRFTAVTTEGEVPSEYDWWGKGEEVTA